MVASPVNVTANSRRINNIAIVREIWQTHLTLIWHSFDWTRYCLTCCQHTQGATARQVAKGIALRNLC